jgi:lantibiotic modifying enzyme
LTWQPLLKGNLKDRACETVQAILNDLAPLECDPSGDPSLASGTSGLAVLHSYVARTDTHGDHAALAVQHLQHTTAAVAERPIEASLYSGLTGVGWVLAHLQGQLPAFDGEEDLAEIDEALLQHLNQSPWRDDYDLISGLVGFGVYALERLRVARPGSSKDVAIKCLERVIDRLAETAELRGDGVTWWTNPAWLPRETREKCPRGYYNLGLAHGVPGVIALLGLACAAGVAAGTAQPLLDKAVRWLLAQEGPRGFASWLEPDIPAEPARLAWCYGDPGVAMALFAAARCVAEPVWEGKALEIARRAAQRPPGDSGVRDAGLCHGAAGLGHLFHRLYQASSAPEFGSAARYWFEQALQMRRPGQGIGGYQARQLDDKGELAWITDPGLLSGSAGIALALLAATTRIEPSWDRMLLAAIPPATDRASGS